MSRSFLFLCSILISAIGFSCKKSITEAPEKTVPEVPSTLIQEIFQYQTFVISDSKVKLNGHIRPYSPATCQFEYGTTTSYGQRSTVQKIERTAFVSTIIDNLMPGMLYHWRIVAADTVGGIVRSSDATFTLPSSVKPFMFPLQIGGVWKYQFIGGINGTTIGIHTWKITGSDGNGNLVCIDRRVDSVGTYLTRNDTVSFVIRDFPEYIQLEFPEWKGLFESSRQIPKLIDATKDTISYSGLMDSGVVGREEVFYVIGVGLTHYSGKQIGMYGEYGRLDLIEYQPSGVSLSR